MIKELRQASSILGQTREQNHTESTQIKQAKNIFLLKKK